MDKKNNVISKDFVTEVAKYFMAFLETDFKKYTQPKRNLITRTNKGLSTGLYLDKYEHLYQELYTNFIEGFVKETIEVKANQHTAKKTADLTSISQITDEKTEQIIKEMVEEISQVRLDNLTDYHNYFESAQEIIKAKLAGAIEELLNHSEQLLESLGGGSNLSQLKTDIIDKIYALAEDAIPNILEDFFAITEESFNDLRISQSESGNLIELKTNQYTIEGSLNDSGAPQNEPYSLFGALKSIFNTNQSVLNEFVVEWGIIDAYFEILQLRRNKDMLDKTELYIYFGEIGINNISFPLFYSPISIEEQENRTLKITFDSPVFVNIKAIEFVVQEYNLFTLTNESVAGKFERILYPEENQDLLPQLQRVVDNCGEVVGLDSHPISLKDPIKQTAPKNSRVNISNRLQLFLFDKSDESLINDYEEIIDNQAELTESFAELINSFITENPVNVIEKIAQEWEEKTTQDKLVVNSPVTLNEEQKQILFALQKPDCRIAIVEGPPGTGKSYTITAIICRALLEGQSVLVLSDKEEALEVVQDKITNILKIPQEHDKDFQNPILRLGKSSRSSLSKIIESQSLERLREHMRTYRKHKEEFKNEEERIQNKAKQILETVIDTSKEIRFSHIQSTILAEEKYGDITWTDNITDEVADAVKKIHQAILAFKNNNAPHLLPLIHSSESLINLSISITQATEAINLYASTQGDIAVDLTEFIDKYEKLETSLQNNLRKELATISRINGIKTLADSQYSDVKQLNETSTIADFLAAKNKFDQVQTATASIKLFAPNINNFDSLIQQILNHHSMGIDEINSSLFEFIDELQFIKSKSWGFGFFGKKTQIEQLTRNLKRKLPYFNLSAPEKYLGKLIDFAELLYFIQQQEKLKQLWQFAFEQLQMDAATNSKVKEILNLFNGLDSFAFISQYKFSQITQLQNAITILEILRANKPLFQLISLNIDDCLTKPEEALIKLKRLNTNTLEEILAYKKTIELFIKKYPNIAKNLNLQLDAKSFSPIDKRFTDMNESTLEDYLIEKRNHQNLTAHFEALAVDDFSNTLEELYRLNAAKMVNVLNTKIINYVDNHTADLRTLKQMLRLKQQFPKKLFNSFRQAFPCILAGIRDYATYIPLEKDLFDLIIIDEASQVSIAQALPALIRGKKILVLGDEKQFSNVKAGTASVEINRKYKNNITSSFKSSTGIQSKEMMKVYLSKIDNFDVKKSILDFCRFITNYQAVLKKHSRSYPEIIGYSNKYFYDDALQCMKVRALPIHEVIKFTQIESVYDQYKLINSAEANFILAQLTKFKEDGYQGTLGIISPHRDQVKFITDLLHNSSIADWLRKRQLKVMTFDTCQGEERDYIFYSMVANPSKDEHLRVFSKSMEESHKEGKEFGTREQRLNVGFSRAKETIHFVLSKPINEYRGEVKTALMHYENTLNTSHYKLGSTDEKSPMEALVQDYFYRTEFYEKNKNTIELIPQFPIGEYLKSLDRNYHHPRYKVDFLLIVDKQKIIIEYDGFEEHFINQDKVNKMNYDSYLKESDIYRQKILEGYGYKFLRLNKFNLGNKAPIQRLNELLAKVTSQKAQQSSVLNRQHGFYETSELHQKDRLAKRFVCI